MRTIVKWFSTLKQTLLKNVQQIFLIFKPFLPCAKYNIFSLKNGNVPGMTFTGDWGLGTECFYTQDFLIFE